MNLPPSPTGTILTKSGESSFPVSSDFPAGISEIVLGGIAPTDSHSVELICADIKGRSGEVVIGDPSAIF